MSECACAPSSAVIDTIVAARLRRRREGRNSGRGDLSSCSSDRAGEFVIESSAAKNGGGGGGRSGRGPAPAEWPKPKERDNKVVVAPGVAIQ